MDVADFFDVYSHLTDEQKLVQQTAKDFVQKKYLPLIKEAFEKAVFPKELILEMGVFFWVA